MDQTEFDKFADEYADMHRRNIRASGESPEFFAEYKIEDMAAFLAGGQDVASIRDFGGGIGASVPYVRRYFPKAELTCLDVSERSLALARERYPQQATFMVFDGATIPFPDGTFDLAFAACVFHHIAAEVHAALLSELFRVVRREGWLFIFEHNPLNPVTQHAVKTCPLDEHAVLISGGRMRRLLQMAGFQNVGLRYRVFFPHALSAFRCMEPFLTWIPFGAQYYVCGQKTESV